METFEPDDPVWFLKPNETEIYTPGIILEYHVKGNVLTIKPTDEDGQFTVENNLHYVKRRFVKEDVTDLIAMGDLSEQAVIWNVKKRYDRGEIYTYVGSILISINPYKMYDIYGLNVVKMYEGRVLGDLPPHLFGIASSSYTRMCKNIKSQVIVISGESGSGKTECTKLIMGYLALVNKSSSNLITEQILEAGPLLESFGNAKTIKNDNSSRFGKYLSVFFQQLSGSTQPIITGGKLREYLLEKSRIVTHNMGERNYHVFYELLKGLNKEQKEKYGLLDAQKYFYLNQGNVCEIQGKNDKEDFSALNSALQILGFEKFEIDTVWKVLGAVLHLGNIYFHRRTLRNGMDSVEIGSDAEIQWIGYLLEINSESIKKCLTFRTTEARKELMQTPLTIDQSLDSRDAIAKLLYSCVFNWICAKINSRICLKRECVSINILDIFGFEAFKENSYEQLCINYSNECLHNYTLRCIFKQEQSEYIKEKLEWTLISYEDNTNVINLLSKKPVGILHLLDDESNFPKSTDGSFLEKLHYNHALDECYLRNRVKLEEFGIKHFNGSVFYNVEGFLDKNRDFLRGDVINVLAGSANKVITQLLKVGLSSNQHGLSKRDNRFITMKPRAPTVAARFSDSLSLLLDNMGKCEPWFVRCFKPNEIKASCLFQHDVVSRQIRSTGILETLKMRKHGYPIRYNFQSFNDRYKPLLNKYSRLSTPRDLTRLILTTLESADYQLGYSKVFIRELLEQRLEKLRYDLFNRSSCIIQSFFRMFLQRKIYLNYLSAVLIIQKYCRMWREVRNFTHLKRSTVYIQSIMRGNLARKKFADLKQRRLILKKTVKQEKTAKETKAVTCVNHLEIPAELAYLISKHDEDELVTRPDFSKVNLHTELNMLEVDRSKKFEDFTKLNFQNSFVSKKEIIMNPFLKQSNKSESLMVFKLILRYMNDLNLKEKREQILISYIVSRGIINELMRDEIYCQILNQLERNFVNAEKGWILLLNCLCCFGCGFLVEIFNYLVNCENLLVRQLIEIKIVNILGGKFEMGRLTTPCYLETKLCENYLKVDDFDVRIESFDSVFDVAGRVGKMVYGDEGFSLELEGNELELTSFVYDLGLFESVGFKNMPLNNYELFPFINSKLIKVDMNRTKSLDDLDSDRKCLSSSKLNERYRSFENVCDFKSDSESEEEIKESLYGKISNRYVKRSVTSNRSYMKSSGMSECSEAPSLVSHVRKVRVPSQASDVDQFLDDLFSPVLGLDDLSDVRSLVSHIKGGKVKASLKNDQSLFIQNAMQQNVLIQQQLIQQNEALQLLLRPDLESENAEKVYIPPPPPLPLEILEGHRPLIDYNGRAKTVRIGKWRWPPKEGELGELNEFEDFKQRLEETRRLDEGMGEEEDDGWGSVSIREEKVIGNEKNYNLVGGKKLARPFGGEVIGKIKLSSEMRAKLELVTSIRGKSQGGRQNGGGVGHGNGQGQMQNQNQVKKLDANRKNMLASKLGMSMSNIPPPPQMPEPLEHHPPEDYEDDLSQVYNEVTHPKTDPQPTKFPELPKTNYKSTTKFPHSYSYKTLKNLKLRKDILTGNESEKCLDFLRDQILYDLKHFNPRISKNEVMRGIEIGEDPIEVAVNWELYLWRFYAVKTPGELRYIAFNQTGIKLVSVVGNKLVGHELNLLQFYSWSQISSIKCVNPSNLLLELQNGSKLSFGLNKTSNLIKQDMDKYFQLIEKRKIEIEEIEEDYEDYEDEFENKELVKDRFKVRREIERESSRFHEPVPQSYAQKSDSEPEEISQPDDGKHSLLQFALKHYRSEKFNINSTKDKNLWTWREQISLVKYSPKMIDLSLLKLDDDLNSLAIECYSSLLKYMGDDDSTMGQGPSQGMVNEVEAVYTLLRNCHLQNTQTNQNLTLQDEVYCQIMKQTTNNSTRSCQRGWRLFTILAAYFPCSEILKPYLFKYLETNAYDKRRAFHGTALVTLQNLRKTFKYGGRRNVPSVEEITAITAGRNAKRQIFRLPGGAQRVVNVKGSGVVEDVIDELCSSLEIELNSPERSEFSVYCIVEGDTFTMPLQREEYILDVTTELQKNQQVYYLIFCRSVWYFPMKKSEVYVEVVFNQIAPDYLEGLLLTLPGQSLSQDVVYDISRIAALLHRAADLNSPPTLKETKYLLPKPALAARDMRPNQWVSLVGKYWTEEHMADLKPILAKTVVLEILEKWDLFGSSFFSVKRIADPAPPEEYIMAMNKNGVHFLDIVTHETLNWWSYGEIISTRKVKNEDGILYLDLKVGNLMQQRITRLETLHAHEISRLIRQYIHIQKYKI